MLANEKTIQDAEKGMAISEAEDCRTSSETKSKKGTDVAKSAAAEIKVDNAANDSFDTLLTACDAIANGRSLFGEADKALFPGVEKAYEVFTVIKGDSAKNQRVIDRLQKQRNCERSPSLNKYAYNAVAYTCRPNGPEEWKLASDWANVLTLAEIEKVTTAAFPDWVKSQKIGAAKRKVRANKRGKATPVAPVKKLMLPFAKDAFPILSGAIAANDTVLIAKLKGALEHAEAGLQSVAAKTIPADA